DPGFKVSLLQEWLAEQKLDVKAPAGARDARDASKYRLLSHCTEQALVTKAPALWGKVFAALGVPLEIVKAGCCGMCGVYGHEVGHKADSLGIFDLSWRKKLDALPSGQGVGAGQAAGARDRVLATGHSCRSQVERTLGYTPRHPVEALLEAVGE
ncbi:MAG TPA: (Fe-S)-binding protein, partial [Polyangia bacterium]|nr:(Fe-S)-binding protein [Polyangia bacterium]